MLLGSAASQGAMVSTVVGILVGSVVAGKLTAPSSVGFTAHSRNRATCDAHRVWKGMRRREHAADLLLWPPDVAVDSAEVTSVQRHLQIVQATFPQGADARHKPVKVYGCPGARTASVEAVQLQGRGAVQVIDIVDGVPSHQ